MTSSLDALVESTQHELEAALRGASLCAVSRDPSAGATTVKYLEGRWYTLRDLQRRLESGTAATVPEAADSAEEEILRRTPPGEAWQDYVAGARSALAEARALAEPGA